MIEHPCYWCGSDGPHTVVQDDDPQRHQVTVECRHCFAQFTVEVD